MQDKQLPEYAVFDDYRHVVRIAVLVRWFVLLTWFFLHNSGRASTRPSMPTTVWL